MSHGAVIRTAVHERLWQMMQLFGDWKDNARLQWRVNCSHVFIRRSKSKIISDVLFIFVFFHHTVWREAVYSSRTESKKMLNCCSDGLLWSNNCTRWCSQNWSLPGTEDTRSFCLPWSGNKWIYSLSADLLHGSSTLLHLDCKKWNINREGDSDQVWHFPNCLLLVQDPGVQNVWH